MEAEHGPNAQQNLDEEVMVIVNLPRSAVEILDQLSATRHASHAEMLRRCIELEKLIHDEVEGGAEIILEHPSKPLRKLILA